MKSPFDKEELSRAPEYVFKKEEVIQDIKDYIENYFSHWHILNCPDVDGDLVLIRSFDVMEEVTLNHNASNPYRNVKQMNYQVVLVVNVDDVKESGTEDGVFDERFHAILFVSNRESLIRFLRRIDSKGMAH